MNKQLVDEYYYFYCYYTYYYYFKISAARHTVGWEWNKLGHEVENIKNVRIKEDINLKLQKIHSRFKMDISCTRKNRTVKGILLGNS